MFEAIIQRKNGLKSRLFGAYDVIKVCCYKKLAGTQVATNAPKTVKLSGLTTGLNTLRFEAKNSDISDVTCDMEIFLDDGVTNIPNPTDGSNNFSLYIALDHTGVQSEPYKYAEWSITLTP